MPEPIVPPAPRPGSRPGRSVPREPLTRERILGSALVTLDRDGLDGVTIRAVADALGTGGASLYAHFANKDELIEALLERVYAEIVLPAADGCGDWVEEAKAIVRATRATLGAHQDVARASLGNVPTGPNALTVAERLVAVLRRGGLADQVVAYGVDLLMLYATAVAYEESRFVKESVSPEEIERWQQDMTAYMASLPTAEFPNLVALAGPLTAGSHEGDERFTFGLDILLAGLAAH